METVKNIVSIASDNDKFRRSGSGVMLTSGVQALGVRDRLMAAIRSYDRFDKNNDPYGEHDFGSLRWNGEKLFWKIDYYDQTLNRWEEPCSDVCMRTLTVMLASEY